jgi:undecaprenyl-diphosphatase
VVAAFACDSFSDHWFASHAVKGWKHVASWVSWCGDWPGLMTGAAVAIGGAWLGRWQRTKQLLVAMIVAASIAGLTANVVRAVAGRTRPNAKETQGWHFLSAPGSRPVSNYKYNSFPSAHTTTAMGFVAPVILLAAYRRRYRWLLVPALAIPLLIGWSRLYQSAHHLSDVTVAMVLGLSCGGWIAHVGPWRNLFGGKYPGSTK